MNLALQARNPVRLSMRESGRHPQLCKFCRKPFERYGRGNYCSRKCYHIGRKAPLVIIQCKFCGKPIQVRSTPNGLKRQFCNHSCATLYFEPSPKGKPNLAARKWHRDVSAGVVTEKTGMHGYVCSEKQRRHRRKIFKGRWENQAYREAWFATRNSRKAITKKSYVEAWKRPEVQLARMGGLRKMPNKGTKIEMISALVFSVLGVLYVHQPHIPGMSTIPDFYLREFNRVVECDGIYWHSKEKDKRNDRRKDQAYRRKGYRVSRWSGAFIEKEGFLSFVKRLLGR